MMDLERCVPNELAASATWPELLAAIRAVEDWTDRAAEVVDHVYRQRLARLVPAATEDELAEFSKHLSQVVHPRRAAALDGLEGVWASRWRGYRDVLDTRIATLAARDPESVLAREHVASILAALNDAGGSLPQTELREHLGLRAPNLTRILNLMELNDLVRRETAGRQKIVHLGAEAEKRRPRFPRGRDLLVRRSG